MTIGERIKAARKAAGLSQKDLAEKMGVTQSNISQYENDYAKPSAATLFKYAEAIGCGLSDLLFDKSSTIAAIEAESNLTPAAKEKRLNEQLLFYESIDKTMLVPDDEEKITFYFNRLNAAGKERLLSYASDLAQIAAYTSPDSEEGRA